MYKAQEIIKVECHIVRGTVYGNVLTKTVESRFEHMKILVNGEASF